MDLLDDDLVDVVLVLSVLFICVAALAILLAKHCKSLLTWCGCISEKQELPAIHPHRTTIRVARKSHEDGNPRGGTNHVSPPPLTPRKEQQFVYIVPKTPTYKQEMQHHTLSAQSSSTGSTYLPSQIAAPPCRRLSF